MSNKRKRDLEKHLARRYLAGDSHERILTDADRAGIPVESIHDAAARIGGRSVKTEIARKIRRAARAERARVRRTEEWRREESKRRAAEVA